MSGTQREKRERETKQWKIKKEGKKKEQREDKRTKERGVGKKEGE